MYGRPSPCVKLRTLTSSILRRMHEPHSNNISLTRDTWYIIQIHTCSMRDLEWNHVTTTTSRGALFPCPRIPFDWWIFRTNGHGGISIWVTWKTARPIPCCREAGKQYQRIKNHLQTNRRILKFPRIFDKVIDKGYSRKRLQRGGGARNLCHLSQRLRESKLWLSHLFVRLIIHHIIGTTFLRWVVDVSGWLPPFFFHFSFRVQC